MSIRTGKPYPIYIYGVSTYINNDDLRDPRYADAYFAEVESTIQLEPRKQRDQRSVTIHPLKYLVEKMDQGYVLDWSATIEDYFNKGYKIPVFTCWTPHDWYNDILLYRDCENGLDGGRVGKVLAHPRLEYLPASMVEGQIFTGDWVTRDFIGPLRPGSLQHLIVARDKAPGRKFVYAIRMLNKPRSWTTAAGLIGQYRKKPQQCITEIRRIVNYLNLPDKCGFCPLNEKVKDE
jgi:hypothetical protein